MARTAKIAISLPEDLLQGIERERRASGETRSEFLRRAVEAFLRREQERQAIEQYVRGYRRQPETKAETAFAGSTAQPALAENPWEEGAEP